MSESDSSRAERDAAGRFSKGNQAAAGARNPAARHAYELARAVREATSPADVLEVLARLRAAAMDGDTAAAALWLTRVAGPARVVAEVELPDVVDAPTATQAFAAIVRAAAAGEVDIAVAERLAVLVRQHADAVAYEALAARLSELEARR
ncbi:MAG: hypothetical protein ACK53T_12435 [Planctomycetota bacterium]